MSGFTPSIFGYALCWKSWIWFSGVTTTLPSRFVLTSFTACAATSSSIARMLNREPAP